jgi:hypothetical protein
MIATAFATDDMDFILAAGLLAIDPNCTIRQIVLDVRRWHQLHPTDWRTTRTLLKEKYSKHDGAMRDRNGYELNTASTIAALLYGRGDFIETLKTAFNFGWDADNNAATAGTIIGVIRGYRWMTSRGWNILDRYRNTTRDHMPTDETITSFAERLIGLSEKVILEQRGHKLTGDGQPIYCISTQQPANILPLTDPQDELSHILAQMNAPITQSVLNSESHRELALAAYSAICLDLSQNLKQKHPAQWQKAIEALNQYPNVLQALFFNSPTPAGDALRHKAPLIGLNKPAQKARIW